MKKPIPIFVVLLLIVGCSKNSKDPLAPYEVQKGDSVVYDMSLYPEYEKIGKDSVKMTVRYSRTKKIKYIETYHIDDLP